MTCMWKKFTSRLKVLKLVNFTVEFLTEMELKHIKEAGVS